MDLGVPLLAAAELLSLDSLAALLTLTALEIVLGIELLNLRAAAKRNARRVD